MTNARAEALLDKQGIRYEREPNWIAKGQKPDFYCEGRPNFWCEVKTLGRLPDDEDQELRASRVEKQDIKLLIVRLWNWVYTLGP